MSDNRWPIVTNAELFGALAARFSLESALVTMINYLVAETRDDAELGAAVREASKAYFAAARARRDAEIGLPAQAAACSGSSTCSSPVHEHGCFADLGSVPCAEPHEHSSGVS